MHLVGFIIRIYHDARSCEYQKFFNIGVIPLRSKPAAETYSSGLICCTCVCVCVYICMCVCGWVCGCASFFMLQNERYK